MKAVLFACTLSLAAGSPEIRVQKGGWGKAGVRDIEKVLDSAAETLWAHFPDRTLKPIHVSRSRSGPISLYQRGPNGEIRVKLDVEGLHWAQFAYQFAHEFGHILCDYDEDRDPNEWFEEMICELASLYALRKMAETWKENPPYSNWKGYASALRKYADDRMEKQQLPKNTTLAEYYAGKEKDLRGSKELRDINGVIATALLPLFEAEPGRWEAVSWINREPAGKDRPLRAYLAGWRRHAPERHRPFITKIAARLGVRL